MGSAPSHILRRRLLPGLLVVAILAAVLGGAFAAGVGPTAAPSSCTSSNTCPAVANPPVPTWVWGSIAGIIVAAIIAGLLIYQHERRRRPPSSSSSDSTEEMDASAPTGAAPAGPSGGAGGSDEMAAGAVALGAAGAASAATASGPDGPMSAAAGMPDYVEGPEDVAAPSAVISQAIPTRSTPASAELDDVDTQAGEEPNIDDLMNELDRISGEILRKDAKPKGGRGNATSPPPEPSADGDAAEE